MNETIRDFLAQPETLETALEIEAHLTDTKKWLFQTFWEHVGDELQQRLATEGHDRLWVVQFDDNIFQIWTGFDLAWREASETPCFRVRAECLAGKGDAASYGICRGQEIKSEDQIHESERELQTRLFEKGFQNSSPQWPAYRYFHQCQLPRFEVSRAEDLLVLSQDLQDAQRPLTRRVADQMWQLFDAVHRDLDDLNRAYPYPGP